MTCGRTASLPAQLAALGLLTVAVTVGCAPLVEDAPPDRPKKQVTRTVTGRVIGGGDATPEGLQDSPRQFVYEVETAADSVLEVAYTAYPPSPAAGRRKIVIDLHGGTVQRGDYVEARGRYDEETGRLTVADSGDYFRTYPAAPDSTRHQ